MSFYHEPYLISDEMRQFLSLSKNELISRHEVNKRIHKYIKDNGLQDTVDKRIINTNGALRKLLKIKKNDNLTFFNLSKYTNVHFQENICSITSESDDLKIKKNHNDNTNNLHKKNIMILFFRLLDSEYYLFYINLSNIVNII